DSFFQHVDRCGRFADHQRRPGHRLTNEVHLLLVVEDQRDDQFDVRGGSHVVGPDGTKVVAREPPAGYGCTKLSSSRSITPCAMSATRRASERARARVLFPEPGEPCSTSTSVTSTHYRAGRRPKCFRSPSVPP